MGMLLNALRGQKWNTPFPSAGGGGSNIVFPYLYKDHEIEVQHEMSKCFFIEGIHPEPYTSRFLALPPPSRITPQSDSFPSLFMHYTTPRSLTRDHTVASRKFHCGGWFLRFIVLLLKYSFEIEFDRLIKQSVQSLVAKRSV